MHFPFVALAIFISSLSYSESFGVNVNAGRSITSKSTQILRTRSSQSRFSPSSLRDKWDDLIDDDEVGDPLWQGPPIPRDMKYNEFNLKRQYKNFSSIRAVAGAELTNDMYVRDSDSDVFWFAGKIARISDVSLEKAVARQYPLIEEHAARLRPNELFSKNGLLELWATNGDSEMDVAYNRPSAKFLKMKRATEVDGANEVRNVEVGFQGEIYEGGEEGFRSQRTDDGLPLYPEIVDGQGSDSGSPANQ